MTTTPNDPRPVPTPLGWCAECVREGVWLRALTLWQGTAMCAQHVVFKAGVGDVELPGDPALRDGPTMLVDQLMSGIRNDVRSTGF